MKKNSNKTSLVIAVTSKALFDMEKSDKVYREKGIEKYTEYQVSKEKDTLEPGPCFSFIQKMLTISEGEFKSEVNIEVVMLSHNTAESGMRVANSIEHYDLPITTAVFRNGESVVELLKTFSVDLFLTSRKSDAVEALELGVAAAVIDGENSQGKVKKGDPLKIAFDGDGVLFSDASEIINSEKGLDAFIDNERSNAEIPLVDGPFKKLVETIHAIQEHQKDIEHPIRTALVTSRGIPCHKRAVRTLESWGIRIDEYFFLGGKDKTESVKAFNSDLFFDDSPDNCEQVGKHSATAHVPHGILNPVNKKMTR